LLTDTIVQWIRPHAFWCHRFCVFSFSTTRCELRNWRIAMDELPLGAHLTSPRRGFVHHGVYVGNGQVIQYSGFERLLRKRPIELVSLADFTRGRGFAVVSAASTHYTGIACVVRARSRLGENRYRIFSNNCEHFVEWCVCGKSRSRQVEVLQQRFRDVFLRAILPFRLRAVAAGRPEIA
jgi:hypothetical protein